MHAYKIMKFEKFNKKFEHRTIINNISDTYSLFKEVSIGLAG